MPTASKLTFKIENMAEFKRAFSRMEDTVEARREVEAIVLDAIQPAEVAVRRRAPQGKTGNLKRSIKSKVVEAPFREHKRRTWFESEVYAARPEGQHAHLVEYGHRLVAGGRLGKGGRVVGSVPPHPFMRPGFEQAKPLVERRLNVEITRFIERSWSRAV